MTDKLLLGESMMTSAVGVLGSMLIDPAAVGPMLMAVSENDFQLTEQRKVFHVMAELYAEGMTVDPILVNDRLGGKYNEYLANLINTTPTSANADDYARELKRTSRLWQLREIGEALLIAEDETESQQLIDKANLLLCERSSVKRMTMEQGYREFWKRKNGTGEDYLSWGFSALDKLIHVGGGDVTIIGGRPSAGKTALVLQFAFHMAKTKKVGFFSYETSNGKLVDRTIACQTQTSFDRIMQDALTAEDYARIRSRKDHIIPVQLDWIEASGMTVNSIGSYAMAYHYDVIVIDYLQKIPMPGIKDRIQRVTEVSDRLQALARQTGKAIVALSQLKRVDDDKPPTMADLRESGQIEQDAAVIMLLYRENVKDKRSRRVLDIAKNKDGEPDYGMLLDFDGDKQTFSPVKKEPQKQTRAKPTGGYTEAYYEYIAQRAAEQQRRST